MLQFGFTGSDQSNEAILARHIVNQSNGSRLSDRKRNHGMGIDHDPSQRKDRQLLRNRKHIRLGYGLSERRALVADDDVRFG